MVILDSSSIAPGAKSCVLERRVTGDLGEEAWRILRFHRPKNGREKGQKRQPRRLMEQ